MKRYTEALEDSSRAKEIDSKFVNGYNGKGSLYLACKKLSYASRKFKEAIKLKPDDLLFFNKFRKKYQAIFRKEEDLKNSQKSLYYSSRTFGGGG